MALYPPYTHTADTGISSMKLSGTQQDTHNRRCRRISAALAQAYASPGRTLILQDVT